MTLRYLALKCGPCIDLERVQINNQDKNLKQGIRIHCKLNELDDAPLTLCSAIVGNRMGFPYRALYSTVF